MSCMARVAQRLPESPFLYPEDEISTQPVRFFVAELVRETALEQLHDEVPYSVAVRGRGVSRGSLPGVHSRSNLCRAGEPEGASSSAARAHAFASIGEAARKKIETFVGEKVYLDLWVKVLANWRKNPGSLSRFGYQLATGRAQMSLSPQLLEILVCPEVQGRARVSRSRAGAAVSQVPAALRRARRHPHHADR